MNPLLSFWIKVQPLSSSFGSHSWKAVSQSSTIASSSGDDTTVQRTTTSSSWAFDCLNNYLNSCANRLASHVYRASSSWLLNPMISRMQDAPMLKPSSKVICEGLQRYPSRSFATTPVNTTNTTSSLLQSQQLLQREDYIKYQIPPPPVRRNSKEWVREYKKERIDKINYNNVFGALSDASNNDLPTLSPPQTDDAADSEGEVSLSRSQSSSSSDSSKYLIHPISPTPSTTIEADSVVSTISLSHPSPPTSTLITSETNGPPSPNDVICGRGGKANTHAGNISFREEAKKLRTWYESSSKSEKFTISSFLVDIVRERGGRFLKRNPDEKDKWLECDGSDVRKKASQALREGRRHQ